jgi:hypothetical protein
VGIQEEPLDFPPIVYAPELLNETIGWGSKQNAFSPKQPKFKQIIVY